MRTNIEIDPVLMKQALDLSGLTTKKAIVNEALQLYVRLLKQKEILALKGKMLWDGDLESSRKNL